jgi:hypothetical protein
MTFARWISFSFGLIGYIFDLRMIPRGGFLIPLSYLYLLLRTAGPGRFDVSVGPETESLPQGPE